MQWRITWEYQQGGCDEDFRATTNEALERCAELLKLPNIEFVTVEPHE